jgi:hypothetical protein
VGPDSTRHFLDHCSRRSYTLRDYSKNCERRSRKPQHSTTRRNHPFFACFTLLRGNIGEVTSSAPVPPPKSFRHSDYSNCSVSNLYLAFKESTSQPSYVAPVDSFEQSFRFFNSLLHFLLRASSCLDRPKTENTTSVFSPRSSHRFLLHF